MTLDHHELTEDVFLHLVRIDAVRLVRLVVDQHGMSQLCFSLVGSDLEGLVYTQRRTVKKYRIETALRLVRGCGLCHVPVDLSAWLVDLGHGGSLL